MSRLPTASIVLVALLAAASGCTRAKANTSPDVPPLEMPVPPPRDVEPAESEPPQPATLPAEPARNPIPARPRPQAPQPRPTEPTRPEPPKAEPPPPVITEAPRSDETPKPSLQTTPSQAEGEVERTIRATLARATSDLERIDYRRLNTDARTQYDTAKTFVRQADAAIRAKNLVAAKNLADKAAALATQLGSRE